MIDEPREAARTRNAVFLISSMAWGLLLLLSRNSGMYAHCVPVASAGVRQEASLGMLLAMSSPAVLAASWAMMLIAMMSPALIGPVRHIQLRSFVRRRTRSVTLFVLGYSALWMSIGCLLLGSQLLVEVLAPQSYLPGMLVLLVAILWQCSPMKQRCLNRCHAHVELAAFGLAADFSVLRFGVSHGLWCAGSCWAMMFACMLLPRWHMVAMVMAAVFISCERLERPQAPCWRPRGLGKVTRFILAQVR
jgi:predicted metal-binding membrane protein